MELLLFTLACLYFSFLSFILIMISFFFYLLPGAYQTFGISDFDIYVATIHFLCHIFHIFNLRWSILFGYDCVFLVNKYDILNISVIFRMYESISPGTCIT